MRDGKCPKCGSAEVYASRNGLGVGEGFKVGLRPHIEPGFRGMLVPHQTDGLWQFLCGRCGYVEMYLLDDQALAFVRERWVRVPPT
jgi:ribosomal protein S27AE